MGLDVHCHPTEEYESSYSMRKPSDAQDYLLEQVTGVSLYRDATYSPDEVKQMYKKLRNRTLEILKYRENIHKLWSNTDEDAVDAARRAHRLEREKLSSSTPPVKPASSTTTTTAVQKTTTRAAVGITKICTTTTTVTVVETTTIPITETVRRDEGASTIIRTTYSDGLAREFRKRQKKIISNDRYEVVKTKHKWGSVKIYDYRLDDPIEDALLMENSKRDPDTGDYLCKWCGSEGDAAYWLDKIEDPSNTGWSILAFLRHCTKNNLYITTSN